MILGAIVLVGLVAVIILSRGEHDPCADVTRGSIVWVLTCR